MGIVDLDCIASNPNSTILYAIGNAENPQAEVVTALFRSNSNPANVTDITWEMLRQIYSRDTSQPHFKYSRFGDVDCAVGSSGEFTAFFYNPQFSVTGSARLVPMGIQLSGDWMEPPLEIYGSMMYGWTSQNFVHQSFYIEKDGIETVVHAVLDETASLIRFGLVDKNTGYLQLAAIWKLVDGRFMVGELTDKFPKLPNPKTTSFGLDYTPAPTVNEDQRHMVYMNGSLYLYSDTTGLISSFPFSSPHTVPTQEVVFPAFPIETNRRNMVFKGARQNSSYLGYLTRVYNQTSFDDEMTMQLSILDFTNLSDAAASTTITNSTTRNFGMSTYATFKETKYLQAIGGRLPGQAPFAVSLTHIGYYGINLEGPSMEPSLRNGLNNSTMKVTTFDYLRSRFRNHDNQVIPGYISSYGEKLSDTETIGIAIGAISALIILAVYCMKFNRWLEKIRLDDEKRAAADLDSFELVSRLRHVSGHSSSNTSPNPSSGGTGASPFDSPSANTSSPMLLDRLGLTRHPQPNTVITIGDDDDEPVRTRVDPDTQQ